MPIDEADRRVVEDLTRAMQIGPAAEDTLLELFTDSGVLVEPFSGQTQTHTGKDAIRTCLHGMWQNRAPDLTLTLNRVDLDGDSVRAEWTCTSAMMPGPMRGIDYLTIHSGKITRLEIVITEMPELGSRGA
jgi:hypothetical protein